jgi:hypothetical protein
MLHCGKALAAHVGGSSAPYNRWRAENGLPTKRLAPVAILGFNLNKMG